MISFRLLGFATAVLATPAYAGSLSDQQFQAISEEVFRPVIEEFDIPGIAIGVTLNGQQYYFTDGMADRDAAVPVDKETIFELGSNSKLFNVTLAALAEQKGLLSLRDPVSKQLPELSDSAFDQITLYDLAAHATGGLPLQVPDDITDNQSLMAYLAKWRPEGDTKSLRSYSNVSIGLLGLIVGDKFGGSYEEALQGELLPCLGLTNTYVTVPVAEMGHYAFGYSRTDNRPIRVNPGMLDSEAYGIKSSVTDMTRLLDAHLGNIPLNEDMTAALARTRVSEFDTAPFAQAMIWEGYPWPVEAAQLEAGNSADMAMKPQPMTHHEERALEGAVFLNKTGATNGFGSYVALVPSEKIGVVVLANRNYPNPVRAAATLTLITKILDQAGR
ncbi:class C beta-lactamase [Paracoccus litorisediminis]|uniref:Class C beta-lactamase n=1 Tax=Paracoccus litorisediminis TaxID=2006130 RepID=A0A844HNX6_9RHOB|nr:class C beta-lactamase [Paracoccus litorisediminis]MTH62063.1 class C beta-lactamase [Paracoccus litorisediminis]